MTEIATLAGGCFWCLEAVFEPLKGVERVVSGYIGGRSGEPTYEEVCSGTTGHAEAVQLTFDPAVISYRDLLSLFFAFHDPTTKDRQGPDIGSQYRSAIFVHSPAQREEAERLVAELDRQRLFSSPIVTEIGPAGTFYPAEEYHQNYYRLNPEKGYCQAMISPKLAKLRSRYANLLAAPSRV
jgi:peptide-methionine (S)-S-oxide reductase